VINDLGSCVEDLVLGEGVKFIDFDSRFQRVVRDDDLKNHGNKETQVNSPRLKQLNHVLSLVKSTHDLNSDHSKNNIAELLVKQGEVFCREIWPGLSIRNIFFKHCNINETLNTVNDTLPVMTEMDADTAKTFTTETKKMTAKDILGNDVPDLSFMLASNIQWPPEYLNQI
jgi:hypothetical protein